MTATAAKPLLLGSKGCGNAIIEFAFALARLPLDCEEVDYAPGSPTRARLLSVNPLGQVPALVLPGGRVLTESLAMLHYVDDHAPGARLVPPTGDPVREPFYRWAVFLVAAVYPTFTYGDDPRKWVPDETGATQLRESSNRHREALYRELEAAASGPWFLGATFSAIDLYLAAMTRWRPGPKWFAASTPKLASAARLAAEIPDVAPVFARHFG